MRPRFALRGVVAAALLLAVPVAALALPDVGEQAGGAGDTVYSPQAKERTNEGRVPWTYAAGARFKPETTPEPGYPEGSVTPTEIDFHDVAVEGDSRAYAVGSLEVSPGKRVPVIYGYSKDASGDEVWEEVYRSPDNKPGYAARVVWADRDTVLAVGGDGQFPEREKADGSGYCAPGEADPGVEDSAENGGAGKGRVWILEAGSTWRELGEEELPPGLRALTALDSHYSADPTARVSFAVAGGLCQLWHLRDGAFLRTEDGPEFAPPYDSATVPRAPEPPVSPNFNDLLKQPEGRFGRPEFRLRVRDIRFAESGHVPATGRQLRIAAVTSGCCIPGSDQYLASPVVLDYRGPSGAGEDPTRADWSIPMQSIYHTTTRYDPEALSRPDSVYALGHVQTSPTLSNPGSSPGWTTHHLLTAAREPSGGPVDTEPPSAWASAPSGPSLGKPEWAWVNTLSSVRLVDSAGNADVAAGRTEPLPDWAVGTLRSTGQAIALATNEDHVSAIGPADSRVPCTSPEMSCVNTLLEWEPTTVERLDASRRSFTLLKLPIYGLGGVDISDEHGVGWAVGRYGGIARYSDGRFEDGPGGAPEPPAPRIGTRTASSFPAVGLYDPFRELAGAGAGEVPALLSQPLIQLDRPRLQPAGMLSGNRTISEIAMSPDGSEGWAIAGDGLSAVLLHYSGGEWRRCRHAAADNRFPADPKCSALPVAKLRLMTVVPTDDGSFELFALAGGPTSAFIYRDGEWKAHPDPLPANASPQPSHAAFASPKRGLIALGAGHPPALFRYDADRPGEKWVKCAGAQQPGVGGPMATNCGDDEGRLDYRSNLGTVTPRYNGLVAAAGRIYMYGSRVTSAGYRYPWIVVYDGQGWSADAELGGLDPGCPTITNRICQDPVEVDPGEMGDVTALTFGDYADLTTGWAFGTFGEQRAAPAVADTATDDVENPSRLVARFDGDGWQPLANPSSAFRDYASDGAARTSPAALDAGNVLYSRRERLFRFDADRRQFVLVDAGRRATPLRAAPEGDITALAGAGRSAWVGVGNYFFHYTDAPHREVFEEMAHPLRDVGVSGGASGPDGSVWLSTRSDRVYRHDRLTGWESARIKGWDRGRVVTRTTPATAIAVGSGGQGLVVGEGGRIATIDNRTLVLDPATGKLCSVAPVPPCGTSRNLTSAAVAPDGSALVGGENRALLWRPSGGDFRAVATPSVPRVVDFTGVSMPTPDDAWAATSDGRIFKGTFAGAQWWWVQEGLDEDGRVVAIDESLVPARLNAISVRPDGTGVAVGDRGVVVERSRSGVWARADTHVDADLLSVALADSGGGAVAGGQLGLLLTRAGGAWRLARAPRHEDLKRNPDGHFVTVSLTAGEDATTEALAVSVRESSNRVWRYSSATGSETAPDAALRPLPDAAPPRPGELRLAAWGKTECHSEQEGGSYCREMNATDSYYEVISQRIVEEISDATERDELHGAVFTGDAVDSATHQGSRMVGPSPTPVTDYVAATNGARKFARWRELVADRLDDANVPFLIGIGAQDLADTQACAAICYSLSRFARAGENLLWREAVDGRFGSGPTGPAEMEHGDLRFRQLPAGRLSRRLEDVETAATADAIPAGGGADTHFAVDVEDAAGSPITRIVFADTSMRSLSASDGLQQPLEPRGGQTAWLERVLCFAPRTASGGERCTRAEGQSAIVVTNTPTYTYGPGALEVQPDGASFEALMMQHRVSAVISGRIGWNGLYWTIAPALHSPCPGGSYPSAPPESSAKPCADQNPSGVEPLGPDDALALADALRGAGAPVPEQPGEQPQDLNAPLSRGSEAPVPYAVASGGGGKFASEAAGGGDASAGYWHGYSVVRVDASGDPTRTIVEQRPIYDFITIEAQERLLKAGQRMTLRGWARGPVGFDDQRGVYQARWDRIEGAAVTHRYDLLEADPEQPWRPREDADGEYVPLDPAVATIDSESGTIRAGKGRQERTYAIGLLSVGDKVASYPLAFDPAKSFKPRPALAATVRPPAPQPPPLQTPPAIQVLSQPPTTPPATPPPPAQLPTLANLQLPNPPPLPQIPGVPTAAPTPPPPPPPAPPPPPSSGTGLPLNLNAPVSPISIVPTVIPPTPPPINPAPPGGSAARKEAKQRQAATAKSEEGGGGEAAEAQKLGGDRADAPSGPEGMAATRRERVKPGPSITVVSNREQPSAWARGALYGGALTILAFSLAAGWSAGRPTPRRRPPHIPAPAQCNAWRRRRR